MVLTIYDGPVSNINIDYVYKSAETQELKGIGIAMSSFTKRKIIWLKLMLSVTTLTLRINS